MSPDKRVTKAQGVDYFKKEYERLERLLGSGSLASTKVGELSRKMSVLGAFIGGDDTAAEE